MPLSAPEPLGQNQHVVEFDCGEPALNDWLIRHARQAQASGSAKTSELIALRWQDVDLAKQCIHVRVARVRGINKPTKTPAGMRQVNLQPEALAALLDQKKLKGAADIVFHNPRTNKPWNDDQGIRKVVWTPVLQRANVKYRTPYQTRHTFASMLLSRGENHLWVANQMGHKDWGMIRKVYGRWIAQPS